MTHGHAVRVFFSKSIEWDLPKTYRSYSVSSNKKAPQWVSTRETTNTKKTDTLANLHSIQRVSALVYLLQSISIILLIEEILHHLLYMKSYEAWDILNINWLAGVLPSTVPHFINFIVWFRKKTHPIPLEDDESVKLSSYDRAPMKLPHTSSGKELRCTTPKTNGWNPKMKVNVWKMIFLFKGVIFRFQPLVCLVSTLDHFPNFRGENSKKYV